MVKSADENDEFEKQRTAAIAEVAKTKEVCNYSSWVCLHYYHANRCGNQRVLNHFTGLLAVFRDSYMEALL